MAYYQSKYHVGIDSKGYILSQKNGIRYYQKKRAPNFVNRVGSGDPAYRDSSFWSYFVQSNWRNGAKQLKFDDAGKFWKSSDVDTTQLEELSLSKSLVSAGQLAAGVKVNWIGSWRTSAGANNSLASSSLNGDASLLAYWRFENNSNDSKGANNGTDTSITYSSGNGKFDLGAGLASGSSSKIVLTASSDLKQTGSFSIGGWFKSTGTSQTLFQCQSSNPYLSGYYLSLDAAGKVNFSSGKGTGTTQGTDYQALVSAAAYNDGNFHLAWGVWDGTTLYLYVDLTVTSVAWANGPVYNSPYAQFGALNNTGSNSNYLNGAIDDWAMFSRVLSASEITARFNATDIPIASTSSTAYAGASDGKIYSWDNSITWTEVFDTRKIVWFEPTYDDTLLIGDQSGTERAQAQGFQLSAIEAATTIKGVGFYGLKNTGTPGNITIRIETNSGGVPSGTLANANAIGTISAFTSTSLAWHNVEFTTGFTLSASTQYWIVIKIPAGPNNNNYGWQADASSPTYAGGTVASSTDGGATWTADPTRDAGFRILGNSTTSNCSLITKVGGTKKMYVGSGDPVGTINGDARLYNFDGTTWSLTKVFSTATESAILSMIEFSGDSIVRIGIAPQAKIYKTSDFSTFTLDKDIDIPDNPGYPYAMSEYNNALYVGGGSPELIPTQYYDGFIFYNDTTTWRSLYPYEDTVIKSMEFYDSFLFFGTYFGFVVVFDTSSLNPLFNFKDQYKYALQVSGMKRFDDKLFVTTYPQDGSGETNVGVWVFDRRGFHLAHTVSGLTGFRCLGVINGSLLIGTGDNGYIYKLSSTVYSTTGWYQSSYFDANLPSIPKLYNAITIKHDPLLTGESINLYYKFKESDSWTQLTTGATNAVGDIEQTLTFAPGTTSKKISLKVVLNGPGTSTPRYTETVLQYALYPALKWQWNLRLKAKSALVLADNTTETRTAPQIRADLEALMNTETLYTFVDVDGTSHNVLVNDIDQTSWVINPADVSEDEIALSLLEA